MEYGLAGGEQIIGNDPTMAAPPQRLCTHDRAALPAPGRGQEREAVAEGLTHGIVGIIMKAVVVPKCIDARRHVVRTSAQAAEHRDMLIVDAGAFEGLRQ